MREPRIGCKVIEHTHAKERARDRIVFTRADLATEPLHCITPLTNGTVMLSGAKHLSLFATGIAPGFDQRFFASLRMTLLRALLRESKPAFITCPRNRPPFAKTVGNPS